MAAYLVAGVTRITDPGAFEHWRTLVAPLIAEYGGKVLAAASGEAVEGEWQPLALTIIEFPTMDDLRQFYHAREDAPLRQLRKEAVAGDIVFVDGI